MTERLQTGRQGSEAETDEEYRARIEEQLAAAEQARTAERQRVMSHLVAQERMSEDEPEAETDAEYGERMRRLASRPLETDDRATLADVVDRAAGWIRNGGPERYDLAEADHLLEAARRMIARRLEENR